MMRETTLKESGRPPKNSWLKRKLKITLFRMWAAGAVCFFGAWGRLAPGDIDGVFSVHLIVSLVFLMIVCDVLIVNPVIRLLSGKKALGDKKTGVQLFLGVPLHIARVLAIMLLIVQTYYFLNVFFIHIHDLDPDSVPVPLEPVLFGILYGIYYFIFDIIGEFVLGRIFPSLAEKSAIR